MQPWKQENQIDILYLWEGICNVVLQVVFGVPGGSHPRWHVRRPQLRDLTGGLEKCLQHLAQGQHAGRGRTDAHDRLGQWKAQPPPRPPVPRDGYQLTEWGMAGRPTWTTSVCLHASRPLEEVVVEPQWVWTGHWATPMTCSFKEPQRLPCWHLLPSRPLKSNKP
jgi:hypothetical protein